MTLTIGSIFRGSRKTLPRGTLHRQNTRFPTILGEEKKKPNRKERRISACQLPRRRSAMSRSEIAPSLITRHKGSVMSMVVAPGPLHVPPSSTKSRRPSIVANNSMPLEMVGCPDILALVAIRAWPVFFDKSVQHFRAGMTHGKASRVAGDLQRNFRSRRNDHRQRTGPEMTRQNIEAAIKLRRQIFGHHGVGNGDGKGAHCFASFCLKYSGYRVQIQWVGPPACKERRSVHPLRAHVQSHLRHGRWPMRQVD